jgi:hypothetical protein
MIARKTSLPARLTALFRLFAAASVAGLAAACTPPAMTATAPGLTSLKPEFATLSILNVSGPGAEQARRFQAILAQEARNRGFVLAEANAPVAATKLTAYLDSFQGEGGRPTIAYVLQTSQDGRNRLARVSGTVPVQAQGWAAFDDQAMRLIAQRSLDDLTRQLGTSDARVEAATSAEDTL